ncbi:MAG: peptide-methionine (R)-S-oxide reductase MsrB [Alphaproteobacteria bacterium]|nr:peptide-methionine (R)-S-oxide reductase MsrB [Alphaproteobacteria bacterium]
MNRRSLLGTAALGGAAAALGAVFGLRVPSAANAKAFEVSKTPEEWRKILTPEQYYVLRDHGTERAGTSPLDHEKRKGTFHCAGCDLALYSSEAKYDSGTGWPSFYQPLANAVGTSIDNSLFSVRTEVHCRRCGGHLGHVFTDGPRPTGLRYCMNGVAMKFKPSVAS